ncbi:hypothetical protein FQR65_LT07438 [Abscondita terminalis]|nr:hypothetical protein FQR65_LT07438 [Abscondita terminalis]
MTRKTCTEHSYIDIVVKLCRKPLHKTENKIAWESSPDRQSFFDLFLKENGITTLKEIELFIQMTRNKMPRTRASSMCYKLKNSPISQMVGYGHRLRTRRHTAYNNFVDTSGDDDSNHVRPMRELRSSNRISINQLKHRHSDLWDSGRPKRTCIKQKPISADERLVFDNRNYYKVEVMSNKLRSIRDRKIKSPITSEESEDDKVYNFNKKVKRTSQVTRLNNEAENFLFPHKDDSTTDNETDVTDASSRKKDGGDNTKSNKVIKKEPEEESSMDSISSESSVVKKKRRLTQAEAFILDNQRYYKFETPVSRLRYQGSYLSPISAKNNGEFGVKHSRVKDISNKLQQEKPQLELDDLKFSFEMVPNAEPWYGTFQRQDKGEECYTCYNYFSGYKPFLLPYEMGPLPPLNPRICYSIYDRMKKEVLADTGPSTSEACSTPDINIDTIKTDYNSSTGEDTKSSEDVSVIPEKVHRKSRRRKVLGGRNPRKSPRQHASTLAILSSLLHQRKRRERTCDQSVKNNLSVIAEEKEQDLELDYDELTKNIDDMLLNTYDEIKVEDYLVSEGVNVNVHCTPSAVECLEEYSKGDDVCNGARKDRLNNIPRKPNRKKKKNRTGWPNKNKRHVFRKDGSDSRDGTENASIKNNGVDYEENTSDNNFNKRNKNKNSFSNKLSNINKINGDVQVNKLNGEICFKNVGMPRRKEHRESSSDNCAEVVVPSVGDKIDCVNVDLAKWENAEKLLSAKIRYEDINNDVLFQPIVRVQKLDCNNIDEKTIEKQFNVSTTKLRSRPRRMPASPKSPRMLRRPRGGWYRDRY